MTLAEPDVKCVVCGEMMALVAQKWRCKVCETIWGTSSKVAECVQCSSKYGELQAVREQLEIAMAVGLNLTRRTRLPLGCCSECIEKWLPPGEWTGPATYAGWIHQEIREGTFTPRQLLDSGVPKEFVDFALRE